MFFIFQNFYNFFLTSFIINFTFEFFCNKKLHNKIRNCFRFVIIILYDFDLKSLIIFKNKNINLLKLEIIKKQFEYLLN